MESLTPEMIERRKAQMLFRMKELHERLHGIEDELHSHQSKDWEELATEREQDEALSALGDDGLHEIRMIQAALDRMDAGEYGFCTKCGVRIPDTRLDLLPATPFCPACAR